MIFFITFCFAGSLAKFYLFISTEALGVPEVFPNQIHVDAPMHVATRIHAHGAKAKEVLEGAALILSEVVEQLLPDDPMPPSLPEIVQKLLAEENLFDKYYLAKTMAGARAALTFAMASGSDGD